MMFYINAKFTGKGFIQRRQLSSDILRAY